MARLHRDSLSRIEIFTTAWRELAAGDSFSGLTIEDFETATQPSLQVREDIRSVETVLDGKKTARDQIDGVCHELMDRVVNAVRADVNHGPDSALYRALGYVRKSERKSGLTRKRPAATSTFEPEEEADAA